MLRHMLILQVRKTSWHLLRQSCYVWRHEHSSTAEHAFIWSTNCS